MIVLLLQMPAHRRRPVIAPETRLNAAQHPHVSPIYDPKIQMDDRTLRNLKDTEVRGKSDL